MKTFVILSCVLAAVVSQCPPSGCPPPIDPPNCGIPDCSIIQNRVDANALWPVQGDPSTYWQCAPGPEVGQWAPMRRPCACGTAFNNNENPRRCTFWFDRSWSVPAGCNWQVPPQLPPCAPWCPDCNGPPQVTPAPPQITPSPPQNTPSPPNGNPPPGNPTPPPGCNCPCPPCIWWPCSPCNPCMC